jgi:hypothetical protein
MAVDVEKLLVSVEANLKQFEREMARANKITTRELRSAERDATRAVSGIERQLGRVGGALRNFGVGFVAGLGVEILARAAQATIKSIADIGDAADKLGLTTSAYQELSFAAKLAGVEAEAFAGGMKKLAVNTSDAARGQGEFGEILRLNGVAIKDANGNMLDQTEILARVADLVRNAGSEQDKAAIAQAAFGKSGIELMNLLEGGAAAVVSAMAEAKNAGVEFTDTQIRKAQEFDDRLDTLIEKISVGFKSAFIDAAIGAESFASRAIAAIESVTGKQGSVAEAFSTVLKVNPVTRPGILAVGLLQNKGREQSGIAQDPSLAGRASTAKLQSASGKTSILPPDPSIAADAKRARDEAARDAARRTAEIQRQRDAELKAIENVISALEFEGQQLKRNDLQQAISNELRSAGVKATSAHGKAITALVTENYNLAAAQEFQKETQEKALAAAQEASEQLLEQQQEMRDAWMELGAMGVDALDSIISGGAKAKDVLRDMVKQLASAALQASLLGQGPLASIFGTKKGGGLIGSLISGFGGGGVAAGIYHAGGVAGNGGPSRSVPAHAFAGAPRYHGGGVAGMKPGEIPAVLQRGEIVIPRGSLSSRGGKNSSPPVQIINMPGSGARVDRQQGSDGRLQFLVREAVKSELPGQLDPVLASRYGMRSLNKSR